MRVILLLLLAGGAIVLMSQNWSPVLPLVLFGRETLPLPIAVWLSLGVLAGALTSLSWQLLYYRPQPRQLGARPEPLRDYRQPLTPREIRRQRERNWESRPGADWEAPPPPEDDWNIEEPPEQPTAVQSPRQQPEQRDRAPQSPQPPERSDDAAEKLDDANKIYDANYRILTTPPPADAADAADWLE